MVAVQVVRFKADRAGAFAGEATPSAAECVYLRRGLTQAGGKLPLFDLDGQRVEDAVVRHCLAVGWAEPWFANALNPDWLVCKLTTAGRKLALEVG